MEPRAGCRAAGWLPRDEADTRTSHRGLAGSRATIQTMLAEGGGADAGRLGRAVGAGTDPVGVS